MSPSLKGGITPEFASHVCMNYCRAMCCRGALVLSLTDAEAGQFQERGDELGVQVVIARRDGGGAWVRFSDHEGERCPMLDPATYRCRIYERRPQRCRDFPEKPTPGCPISGTVQVEHTC